MLRLSQTEDGLLLINSQNLQTNQLIYEVKSVIVNNTVSIKHGLRTADGGLRTGYKTRTRYKTRTVVKAVLIGSR